MNNIIIMLFLLILGSCSVMSDSKTEKAMLIQEENEEQEEASIIVHQYVERRNPGKIIKFTDKVDYSRILINKGFLVVLPLRYDQGKFYYADKNGDAMLSYNLGHNLKIVDDDLRLPIDPLRQVYFIPKHGTIQIEFNPKVSHYIVAIMTPLYTSVMETIADFARPFRYNENQSIPQKESSRISCVQAIHEASTVDIVGFYNYNLVTQNMNIGLSPDTPYFSYWMHHNGKNKFVRKDGDGNSVISIQGAEEHLLLNENGNVANTNSYIEITDTETDKIKIYRFTEDNMVFVGFKDNFVKDYKIRAVWKTNSNQEWISAN